MQDESYFAPVSPAENSSLFNGKELQTLADLHLYDYHWRQYDPQLGRWHSPDPADQFHGISGYAYCANNPVMLTDPDGRIVPLIVGAIIVGALVGGTVNVINNWDNIQKNGFWTGLGYFGVGAVAGAAGTAIGIATAGAGSGIGLALAGSIGATTTGVIAGGVIGGVLNYGFDVATFGAHNVDGWQSFFRGATAGMGFFKGGWKGMVDAFFGEKNAYKKYTTESWVSKNLDNPLVNAVKDGILSIADARASGDYKPDEWFSSFLVGSGNSLIASATEDTFKGIFDIEDSAYLNPIQHIGLSYINSYLSNAIFEQDFNIIRPIQTVLQDYFLQDIWQYASWSHLNKKFAKPSLPKIK
jgi:RHS repeat-associated protein